MSASSTRRRRSAEGQNGNSDGLPPGWFKEYKPRSEAIDSKKDPYYVDPESGYGFRSLKDVHRYIKNKDLRYCLSKPVKWHIDGAASVKDEEIMEKKMFLDLNSNVVLESSNAGLLKLENGVSSNTSQVDQIELKKDETVEVGKERVLDKNLEVGRNGQTFVGDINPTSSENENKPQSKEIPLVGGTPSNPSEKLSSSSRKRKSGTVYNSGRTYHAMEETYLELASDEKLKDDPSKKRRGRPKKVKGISVPVRSSPRLAALKSNESANSVEKLPTPEETSKENAKQADAPLVLLTNELLMKADPNLMETEGKIETKEIGQDDQHKQHKTTVAEAVAQTTVGTQDTEIVEEKQVLPDATAPAKPMPDLSSLFGDSWSDPCIEFALKTLAGDIPVLDEAAAAQDYYSHMQPFSNASLSDRSGSSFPKPEI